MVTVWFCLFTHCWHVFQEMRFWPLILFYYVCVYVQKNLTAEIYHDNRIRKCKEKSYCVDCLSSFQCLCIAHAEYVRSVYWLGNFVSYCFFRFMWNVRNSIIVLRIYSRLSHGSVFCSVLWIPDSEKWFFAFYLI